MGQTWVKRRIGLALGSIPGKRKSPKTAVLSHSWGFIWLREKDLNQRPPGYEASYEYINSRFRRFPALSARVMIPSGGLVPVVSVAVFPVMGQNMGQTRNDENTDAFSVPIHNNKSPKGMIP